MIYFNNSATSYPKPAAVIKAVTDNLQQPPSDPLRENVTEQSIIAVCRQRIAKLFAFPDPDRVILCSGATEALNMAIHGLIDSTVSHVISTLAEHNAVLRPLYKLRNAGRIDMEILLCRPPGMTSPDAFRKGIKANTGLAIVNHASNVTGAIHDIYQIYDVCAERGVPLIIDAAQSAGTLEVDFSKMPKAVLVFTGHKGLLGPRGTGGFVAGREIDLDVWKAGGTGIRSDLETMPDVWPLKYEPGTMNMPGIAGLAASVQFILEQGTDYFCAKKRELTYHLIREINKIKGIALYTAQPEKNVGVVSFTIPGLPIDDVGYIFRESFGFRVRTGLHCAPLIHKALGVFPQGTVRASFSACNTADEVDAFIQALKIITGA